MADIIQARVILDGERKKPATCDLAWGILFATLFLVNLGLTIYVAVDANMSGEVKLRSIVCPGGDSYTVQDFKWSSSLKKDYCNCWNSLGGGRRNLAAKKTKWTVFKFMGERWYAPTVIFLSAFVISVGWLMMIKHCAVLVVFGTIAVQIAFGIGISVFLFSNDSAVMGGLCVGMTGLYLGYVIYRKQKFVNAAHFMAQAIRGIIARASILLVLIPLQLFYVFLLWLNCRMWMGYAMKMKVKCPATGPDLENDGQYKIGMFCTVTLLWILFFIRHLNLHVTSHSIATWCFNQDVGGGIGVKAMKIGLTKSAPVLAITSFIAALTEDLRQRAEKKLSWCSPLFLLNILACVVAQLIKTYGRFMVVFHSITSDNFCDSAKKSFAILSKNLEDVLVTDFAGKQVVELGSYVFALCMGLASWAWYDDVRGENTLKPGNWDHSSLFYLLFLVYMYILRYPMICIFIIGIFLGSEDCDDAGGLVTGLFLGSITYLIFQFVGQIILGAVDCVYVCYAIQKEANTPLPGKETDQGKIYYLLEADEANGGVLEKRPQNVTGAYINPGQVQVQMQPVVQQPVKVV